MKLAVALRALENVRHAAVKGREGKAGNGSAVMVIVIVIVIVMGQMD